MLQKTVFAEADVKRLGTIRRTFAGISAESAASTLKLNTRQVFRLKARLHSRENPETQLHNAYR